MTTDHAETLSEAHASLQGGGDDRGRERSSESRGEGVVIVTTASVALLAPVVSAHRLQKRTVTLLIDPASTVQSMERDLSGNTKATRGYPVVL